jgi:2-phospho-L-lactate/phosphoenolpyruvate guanylyltransferase
MRTAAVLPVKRFARAKQRLGESIAAPLRLELARAMVADVLQALSDAQRLEQTFLVTGEELMREAARSHRATIVQDSCEEGQSAAAQLGIERALAQGFERVLCVPGDCPALDPSELDALLRDGREHAGTRLVVAVPDRHGTGTNALLLSPPDAIAPAFGPGSFERHRKLALSVGASWRREQVPTLLLDIDTRSDLAVLSELIDGHGPRAAHTRALLRSAGTPAELSPCG